MNNTDNTFYKVFTKLASASHVLDTETGEEIKITNDLKMVYSYMLNQYQGFSSVGKTFFQTHEAIGACSGCSSSYVKKSTKILKGLGLLTINTKMTKHGRKNTYIVHNLDQMSPNFKFTNKKLEELAKRGFRSCEAKAPSTKAADIPIKASVASLEGGEQTMECKHITDDIEPVYEPYSDDLTLPEIPTGFIEDVPLSYYTDLPASEDYENERDDFYSNYF